MGVLTHVSRPVFEIGRLNVALIMRVLMRLEPYHARLDFPGKIGKGRENDRMARI